MKAARVVPFAAVPCELLVVVLLLLDVAVPPAVVAGAELAVAAGVGAEAVVAWRLYRAARREGHPRAAAVRQAYEQMVPVPVRRVAGFDLQGLHGLLLWATRRPHGVPRGAAAVPYAGAMKGMALVLLGLAGAELIALEVVLRAVGAPPAVRLTVLVLDAYVLLAVLALVAGFVTRPHVVTSGAVRIRYGVFFDLVIPRQRIARVARVADYSANGFTVDGDRVAVPIASTTNLVVELTDAVDAVRPLGRIAPVRVVRFFADDPAAALAALTGSGASTASEKIRPAPAAGPPPGRRRRPGGGAARRSGP